ncbi:MAG: carbon monoxide dehydrogenase subunit G [Chloroflexi bacterium]|nr:carbon monoxide dehydrogenase subunit G [Chloroflexota bacterium]
MEIKGTYTLNAPRERVWLLLMNPEALQRALPGCESLTAAGENTYEAALKVGVGAVRGSYNGTVELKDLANPTSYTMVVEGSGSLGFVRGTGFVELEEQGGATLVKVHGEAEVGGLVAGVGQRLLGGVAKIMIDQFFKSMAGQIVSVQAAQQQ